MLSTMLAEGWFKTIFPYWYLQIPGLIVVAALIIFYVQWKKKQM